MKQKRVNRGSAVLVFIEGSIDMKGTIDIHFMYGI